MNTGKNIKPILEKTLDNFDISTSFIKDADYDSLIEEKFSIGVLNETIDLGLSINSLLEQIIDKE